MRDRVGVREREGGRERWRRDMEERDGGERWRERGRERDTGRER